LTTNLKHQTTSKTEIKEEQEIQEVTSKIDITNFKTEQEDTEFLEEEHPDDYLFRIPYGKVKLYDKRSLYFLKGDYALRKSLVWLIEWNWFDNVILFCILLNSIALAIYNYNDRDSETAKNMILEEAGRIFSIVFTIEAVFKIMAMGFIVHRKSYLREGFNVIDFLVVISGVIELGSSDSSGLKALRILRVLRPLRSINALPKMRKLVSTLINAMPKFINVAAFIFFIFILFSILGMHSFSGVVYSRCRTQKAPVNATYWPKTADMDPCGSLGLNKCKSGEYCGRPVEWGISLEDDGVLDNFTIMWGIA
jgi:hypothetical protein